MLTGTVNFKDAEGFTVKVFDDSASTNRFEFSITSSFPRYRKKKQDEQNECQDSGAHAFGTLQPLEYYLETTFNSIRKRSTVHMRKSSRLQNVRLLLKERIEPKMSCHTKQWRKGREAYYIRCTHSPRNGYLCVKEYSEGGTKSYKVCVKPTVNYRCSDAKVYMLFQLKHFRLDL